jgi:predicted nuclease of predicted toxin-antitoxin system
MPPRRTSSAPPPRFLLDENLSWRVAKALALCEYDVTHVVSEPDLGPGTPDEDIIRWCGSAGHVWVTTDHDPRSRHIRFGLLPSHQVHVILLQPPPRGLHAQLEAVVRNYDQWVRILSEQPAGSHDLWEQRTRGVIKRHRGQ